MKYGRTNYKTLILQINLSETQLPPQLRPTIPVLSIKMLGWSALLF